ncbi:hypothetical protein POSPLADRAFT_1039639 [Postia placenta MAD-698-R-SB12]|uniref:Uncharacterized protein n=1 Tax=Postia placenta MAD-698-R-SB12 TaxID=670580 RepID=A0A1X6N563_9APHY|nr:hypothetical protein POSPLADRAFT_1039639 [Postia placenta MAD-698-R-SB12]OSX63789.1 hypothetical protein POSPLADRAFT_1039639 [Postia placenta MAD-698-R-SB12]
MHIANRLARAYQQGLGTPARIASCMFGYITDIPRTLVLRNEPAKRAILIRESLAAWPMQLGTRDPHTDVISSALPATREGGWSTHPTSTIFAFNIQMSLLLVGADADAATDASNPR